METFVLLAVLFLVFGGCSRGCRRGVRRVRDRVLEGADDLQDALGSGDDGWSSRPAGEGTSAGARGRGAGGRGPGAGSREARTASRRPSPGRAARMSPDDPRRLASLKDRFVRGELTLEEYEREVDKLDLRL